MNRDSRLVISCGIGYAIFTAGLVWFITARDLPLQEGGFIFSLPSPWLLLVVFTYYILPFILASAAGRMAGRFKKVFTGILLVCFGIHWLFSATVTQARRLALLRWSDRYERVASARPGIGRIEQRVVAANRNGIIERVEVEADFYPKTLPPGTYEIYCYLRNHQTGELQSVGMKTVTVGESWDPDKPVELVYTIETKPVRARWNELRAVALQFEFVAPLRLTEDSRRILALSRWAAFARRTYWNGFDPDFREENRHRTILTSHWVRLYQ